MKTFIALGFILLGLSAYAQSQNEMDRDVTPGSTPTPTCSMTCEPWRVDNPSTCAKPFETSIRACRTSCGFEFSESEERQCVPVADFNYLHLDGSFGSSSYQTETLPIKYSAACDGQWYVNVRTMAYFNQRSHTESQIWIECKKK